jgi:Alcohol acetyltransferase
VGLTARYKSSSNVAVRPALFHALSILISKHPILSCIPLAVDTTSPYWVRVPEITLTEIVTFAEDDLHSQSSDWQVALDKVIEEQHNSAFKFSPDHPLPFWRICVLNSNVTPQNFSLVFTFHHSLMDTKSALSFHEELNGYMAAYSGSESSINTIRSPSGPLLPPLEDLCDLSVSSGFLRDQQNYQGPPPDTWTAAPQFLPVKTRFSSSWLSEAETKRLATMSKKQHSSVTAALQTLIATSLFSVIPTEYQTIQADCAVSLRRFLPSPITNNSLGCYVGSLSVIYPRMPFFDWSEARRSKAAIEQALAKKGGDMPVGYLRFIEDLRFWMQQKIGCKRSGAFELSNVGASLIQRQTSKFEIESMLFSQSSSACSAAIKISAITGPDGRMALGFTWQDGIVETDMVKQIQIVLKRELENL